MNSTTHPTKDTHRMTQIALGNAPGDLAVINARVVNVYTGEILDDQAVVTAGPWIAYTGDRTDGMIGPDTEVIDAGGKVLIPGLIDGHTHLAGYYNVPNFLTHGAVGGTTTVITEAFEAYAVAGYDGVLEFLEAIARQPIKIFATAPPMVCLSPAFLGIDPTDLDRLLAREDVLGLGEAYWQGVLQSPEVLLPTMARTLAAGKVLEGHSAGAKGNKLAAYAATGVSSCHEPITAEEALALLRLGIHVMAREGNVRRDLQAIAEIRHAGIDLRRLTLVSDGVAPQDLLEGGYMELVVQRAIGYGFDPVAAIQMTTLNVAEHFRIDHLVGGIAPGRYADLVLIPEPDRIKAELVISNGRVIARQGRLVAAPRAHAYSERLSNTIDLPRPMTAEDFRIPAGEARQTVSVSVIDMVTDLVTKERVVSLPVRDGGVDCDPGQDLVKVATIDRRHTPGKTFTALIRGFGMQAGAVATSAVWDSANLIVLGVDEADMAQAVNRVREMQGGIAVCREGQVLAELALPVLGVVCDLPMDRLAQRLTQITRTLQALGVPFDDPLLSIATLTGAAIPYLRITENGLVHLKTGRVSGAVVQ